MSFFADIPSPTNTAVSTFIIQWNESTLVYEYKITMDNYCIVWESYIVELCACC